MKRFKYFILPIFLFLCFISPVYADGTENYFIEANILENGDMQVKELKSLSGEYNGVKTTIRFANNDLTKFTGIQSDFEGSSIYNGSNITDLEVYDVTNNGNDFNLINQPNTEFALVNSANKGDFGVYTKELLNNGMDLLIYMPSSYNRASLITYTVKDVVVVHNDIAEVAWDFISSNYEEDIGTLKIVVNLPKDSNELRVFSHGPLDGTNRIVNNHSVELVDYYVSSGNAIDMRVVFDKEIVSGAIKKSNIDGLDKILKVEQARADKANSLREEARRNEQIKHQIVNVLQVICVLWFIGLIIIIYKIYIKYDKEHKPTFKAKYFREIPSDYEPGIVSYLMYKDINKDSFGASVLDLIRKKVLILEEIQIEEKRLIGKKTKTDYRLTKNKSLTDINLTMAENNILSLIIDTIGDGNSVVLGEISRFSKDYINAKTFMNEYNSWKNKCVKEATKKGFYEDTSKGKSTGGLYAAIMPVISFLTLTFDLYLGKVYILNIFAFLAIIYFVTINKRTQLGNDEYNKWTALKNFLNDFGNMNDKSIPEIALWERYLVYATVFGIADKVQKFMKIKLQNMNYDNTDLTFLYYNDWYFYHTLNNTLSSTVSKAHSTITQHEMATSTNSSGSGFGGGSSFGGGGFGGGGSGGGRF